MKEDLLPALRAITKEVNYDAMANVFSSKTAFENEIRANKTKSFAPIERTINQLKAVLTEENNKMLNEDLLLKIREEKTERLERETNSGLIKIFLPKDWTLEYDIAGSGLFRLLATAIRAAEKETNEQDQNITGETLTSIWNEVKEDYPDDIIPTREISYEVFAPLNEGKVSKAITSQYLAGMLVGDLPPVKDNDEFKEKIKRIIDTDEKLKYLKDAIEYVTDHPNQ